MGIFVFIRFILFFIIFWDPYQIFDFSWIPDPAIFGTSGARESEPPYPPPPPRISSPALMPLSNQLLKLSFRQKLSAEGTKPDSSFQQSMENGLWSCMYVSSM